LAAFVWHLWLCNPYLTSLCWGNCVYAAKLRSEAKPFEGDRLSKRKHQIGTLFYNAKMKELEIMEGKFPIFAFEVISC